MNDKEKESILHWSNCRGAMNSPFYKNCDKCGRLGRNPSAKTGLVHFLLGAMLPCSTPFCTSAELGQAQLKLGLELNSIKLK